MPALVPLEHELHCILAPYLRDGYFTHDADELYASRCVEVCAQHFQEKGLLAQREEFCRTFQKIVSKSEFSEAQCIVMVFDKRLVEKICDSWCRHLASEFMQIDAVTRGESAQRWRKDFFEGVSFFRGVHKAGFLLRKVHFSFEAKVQAEVFRCIQEPPRTEAAFEAMSALISKIVRHDFSEILAGRRLMNEIIIRS